MENLKVNGITEWENLSYYGGQTEFSILFKYIVIHLLLLIIFSFLLVCDGFFMKSMPSDIALGLYAG